MRATTRTSTDGTRKPVSPPPRRDRQPGSVGYLAAGLPAGVLADRANPWLVLIAGDVIRALIFLTLFVLTGSRAIAPALILSLAFAAGAVTVFSDTALAI